MDSNRYGSVLMKMRQSVNLGIEIRKLSPSTISYKWGCVSRYDVWDRGCRVSRAKDRILEILPFMGQSEEDKPAKLMKKGCSEKKRGEPVPFLREETIRKYKVNYARSCKVFN